MIDVMLNDTNQFVAEGPLSPRCVFVEPGGVELRYRLPELTI